MPDDPAPLCDQDSIASIQVCEYPWVFDKLGLLFFYLQGSNVSVCVIILDGVPQNYFLYLSMF